MNENPHNLKWIQWLWKLEHGELQMREIADCASHSHTCASLLFFCAKIMFFAQLPVYCRKKYIFLFSSHLDIFPPRKDKRFLKNLMEGTSLGERITVLHQLYSSPLPSASPYLSRPHSFLPTLFGRFAVSHVIHSGGILHGLHRQAFGSTNFGRK